MCLGWVGGDLVLVYLLLIVLCVILYMSEDFQA